MGPEKNLKVGIFVIAYQAEKTILELLKRIPLSIWNTVEEVFVIDDASNDKTFEIAKSFAPPPNSNAKFVVMQNEKNQGYGGNQKVGYNYAIKKGMDIVVMLHGDLQYSPESMQELIKSLNGDKAHMSYGSRMLGDPIGGGMPYWRYFGNKFLTFVENSVLGYTLSEYHSGFRAYKVSALNSIPFNSYSNNYVFDTEIITNFRLKNFTIVEIPIPTHYGPESRNISFTKAINYGLNILKLLVLFMLNKNQSKNQ